jgi:hypothetical protein
LKVSRRKVFPPGGPENVSRRQHQHRRHPEGPAGAIIVEQPGNQHDREKGTEVHRKVEPPEGARDEMLVARAELVADVRGDTGLDAARAEGDEAEADGQAQPRLVEREHDAAQAVDQREPDDRLVFAPEGVGDDRAQGREKIIRGQENMHPLVGIRLIHRGRRAGTVHEVFRHEHHEHRAHPVEIKSLGRLVADDVGDARRHRGQLLRRGEIRRMVGHEKRVRGMAQASLQ